MRRRGTILVMTMVIISLAGMIAVSLLFRARAELHGEVATRNGQQAYQAAQSGIAQARSVLQQFRNDPSIWLDNEGVFKNQLVFSDGSAKWYFTVYAPDTDNGSDIRYGVIDEAGKINVNTADEKTLLALPGMDQPLVDSLLDWLDSDDTPRANGAEIEYYGTLQPIPYYARNGTLSTIDELMFVKGFDASLVMGEDFNLNGILDANEDDGDELHPPDDGNGQLNQGLTGLLTTVSYEFDVDNEGEARVNINDVSDDNCEKMKSAGISDQTIKFLKLYLAEGNTVGNPADLLEMKYELKQDHDEAKYPGAKKGVTISSGVGGDKLAIVMDKLTCQAGGKTRTLAGLLNINSASVKVLASLPQIDENLAQQIVSERSPSGSDYETIAWLFTKSLVDAETFKAIAPILTARSFQFRIRCVGFGLPSGQFCVLEAVVDLANEQAKILYMRDITRLGLPTAIKVDNGLGRME